MITHLLTDAEREALGRYRSVDYANYDRSNGLKHRLDALTLADALLRLCPEDDGGKRPAGHIELRRAIDEYASESWRYPHGFIINPDYVFELLAERDRLAALGIEVERG